MDLKQYTRMNNVVITGFQVKPQSYASAVTADSGGKPAELDARSTEQQVAVFLQSKGISLDCDNTEDCLLLPRRNASDKLDIILRFINRKHKMAL